MIPQTERHIVDKRLTELLSALDKPSTIRELSVRLNRSRKLVYKDLAKLIREGTRIGRKLNLWWIEKLNNNL